MPTLSLQTGNLLAADLSGFTPLMAMALAILFTLSWLIQTAEFAQIFRMLPRNAASKPMATGLPMETSLHQPLDWWDWSLQRADIPNPTWRRWADALYSPTGLRWQLWLRAGSGLALPWLVYLSFNCGLPSATALFLTVGLLLALQLLMLIRWRGAFNGGSDFMTLMVLLGLFIAAGVNLLSAPNRHPDLGWRAGFAFIALQAISSYFLSGSVKLLRPEWRNGRALTLFLNEAVRGPLPPGHWLRQAGLARLGSWAFILWECAFPLALLHAEWALLFCLVAAVFHFLVFWFFGLNRFFWAWLATFPAIIWCAAAHWN